MKRNAITYDQAQKIKELHKQGIKQEEIAEIMGMSLSSIKFYKYLDPSDENFHRPITTQQKKEIINLYERGYGMCDIGRKLNKHPNTVKQILIKENKFKKGRDKTEFLEKSSNNDFDVLNEQLSIVFEIIQNLQKQVQGILNDKDK